MEESLDGARLHTAEHIFARALQEQKLDIHVRKADTYNEKNVGKAYIREIVPFSNIRNAELEVNKKIAENLEIRENNFKTIEDAIKANPLLRFNEERLEGKQDIRVVTIGNYDFSACKHRHVQKTGEIIAFSVSRISYLGGETEIEFLAGTTAVKSMIVLKDALLNAAMENHFIAESVKEYLEKQKKNIKELEEEEEKLFSSIISLSDYILDIEGLKLSRFYNLLSSVVRKDPKKCIAVTNRNQLIIIKGRNSDLDLVGLGKKLKEIGFSGSINETTINGRVNENIIAELKKEWKILNL